MENISKIKNPDGWVLGRGVRAEELARLIVASAETRCATIVVGETGSALATLLGREDQTAQQLLARLSDPLHGHEWRV